MKLVAATWATLAVTAVTLSHDATARASEPDDLPAGIHLGSSGRYFQDVCDRRLPSYCLSRRLLPEGFDPLVVRGGKPPRPLFGGQFCQAMQMPPGSSSPAKGALTPADVVAAYSLSSAIGAHGQIVAIIDMPDSTAFSDITT